MKRLFFVATLAIMAAGCQKTFVQDEVQTPIGFSTEVGKQTRAIVQDTQYPTSQPFAVYAYGHQDETNKTNTIMDNVEIFYDDANDDKWRANDGLTYYWPNDPRTSINFYAYSPVSKSTTLANHQKLHFVSDGKVSHTENGGLILSSYKHTNMYVDFMVASPVLGATYQDQDGPNGNDDPSGAGASVPVSFAHQMTQVNFTVKLVDQANYPNVDFTINSITLNSINDQANYSYKAQNKWTTSNDTRSYTVFPATTSGVNAAPQLINASNNTSEALIVLHTDTREDDQNTNDVDESSPQKLQFSTTPVTMIPQTFTASNPVNSGNGHSFTINYDITGVGVAEENVIKTFDLPAGDDTNWIPNRNITYVLTIGLNEITFEPSVQTWDATYDHDGDNQTPDVNYGADVNI